LAIYAGIDEAGFGPLLGPLVVGGTAFRVPDEQVHACLWDTLRETCTRQPQRASSRLVIADSKKVYHSAAGFAGLERAALVMLAKAGKQPTTWRQLVETVAPQAAAALERLPWYADADVALPVDANVGDVRTRANAIRADAATHGVEFLGGFVEPVLEDDYNDLVGRTDNKSTALQGIVFRVIDRILRATDDPRVRLCVDRLGGRTHYREPLQLSFPEFEIEIVEESSERSAYRLSNSARVVRIEFAAESEDRHLPVALASLFSKYLRELFMRAFNAYWCGKQPDLRPTAGYYTDAKRWLRDAEPMLQRCGVSPDRLVRQR
jgi:hypothetical protein